MKKQFLLLLIPLLFPFISQGQNIGIGTTAPDASSLLEVRSTNKGFLVPRMNTNLWNSITSPAKGLMVYDSVGNRMMMNTGTPAAPVWRSIASETSGWGTSGNGTTTATNYLGTNTAQPLIFKTNNTEWMRILDDGRIGIGTDAPTGRLQIETSGLGQSHLILRDTNKRGAPRVVFNNSTVNFRNWTMSAWIDSADGNDDAFSIRRIPTAIGATEILALTGEGRVGIGTRTPKAQLDVMHDNKSILNISGMSTSDTSQLQFVNKTTGVLPYGTTFSFTSRGSSGLTLTGSTSSLGIGTIVGQDLMHFATDGTVTVMDGGTFNVQDTTGFKRIRMTPRETRSTGAAMTMYNADNQITIDLDADNGSTGRGRITLDEISIKGGSDFAEEFNITAVAASPEPVPGMLVSIDPEKEGNVRVTTKRMDKRILGVISGANGVSAGMVMGQKGTLAAGDHPVAIAGRVYVLATKEGGDIAPGDFLTSSSTKGYAMKADGKKSQGSIIGKAMSKRNPETGFVLVMINLQ